LRGNVGIPDHRWATATALPRPPPPRQPRVCIVVPTRSESLQGIFRLTRQNEVKARAGGGLGVAA